MVDVRGFPEAFFEIPPFPSDVKKVVDPRDLRLSRLPPPGYDMRTLRKQVDSLHQEIENRIEAQEIMYVQNNVLWEYVKSLYKCNRDNAEKLRDYFQELHSELIKVHKERCSLAQRLSIAQSSESVLKMLIEEQRSELSGCLDEEKMMLEADSLLKRWRSL